MKAVQLTKEEAVDFWDMVAPYLQSVLDKTDTDEYGLDYIFSRVQEETLALFIMIDDTGTVCGAYTVSVDEYPQGRVATIVHLGADDIQGAIDCYPKMESYAKANRASKLAVFGRKGWTPTLRNLGFAPTIQRFEKVI